MCMHVFLVIFALSYLFSFFPFVKEKTKTCFNPETNDFNQQKTCGAPDCWSKYTIFYTSITSTTKKILQKVYFCFPLFLPFLLSDFLLSVSVPFYLFIFQPFFFLSVCLSVLLSFYLFTLMFFACLPFCFLVLMHFFFLSSFLSVSFPLYCKCYSQVLQIFCRYK